MAKRAGRKKTPTEIKRLRGTLRADRVLDNELSPELMKEIPAPPDDLKDDGKELWWLVVLQAHKLRILTKISLPQIVDYCTQWEVYCANRRIILGMDTPGVDEYTNGNMGLSAQYKAMNEARKQMRYFETEWGLTPSSAAGIPAPEQQDEKKGDFDL